MIDVLGIAQAIPYGIICAASHALNDRPRLTCPDQSHCPLIVPYGEVVMAPQSQPIRMRIYAQASVIGCGLLVTGATQAMEGRPPFSAACRAWNSHIAELIDQHRTAHEVDDNQIGEIMRLFVEAQRTCSALRFEEALAIYEAIPIEPVASRPFR